jgi:hypothetical protein
MFQGPHPPFLMFFYITDMIKSSNLYHLLNYNKLVYFKPSNETVGREGSWFYARHKSHTQYIYKPNTL